MKKNIILTAILLVFFSGVSFAATVGGETDMTLPESSFFSRDSAIREALDSYETPVAMKAGFDVEFLSKKELNTATDVTKAKIEGQNVNFKFSMNYSDVLEPYIKVGTSNLKVKWEQRGDSVTVEAQPGLVYAGGLKAKLWEFASTGIKLTLDGQYKNTQLDVDKAMIGGSSTVASATSTAFDIKDYQVSLLASKKFIFPMGVQDCYTVPYMGLTWSDSEVNVHFTQSTTGGIYSTYDASNKNTWGVVLGIDIIPSLLSWYLFSFELRLVDETAFSISGTMKF
ncbi:MAG: hypothetical protein Q8O12_06910 [Candidatus Omnitrophota bacterium]|nr:hypothetical protein [Candidatus Omnitrophota bacterium]